MKRRAFVGSIVAGVAALACSSCQSARPAASCGREWVQLSRYTCSSAETRDRLVSLFDAALVPALNRQGASKVGVFWSGADLNGGNAAYDTTVFTVAAFPTLAACADSDEALLRDARFMREASALFEAPMKTPLFDACERSVLRAFATCPTVVPVTDDVARLLQLRVYNSYTIERNAKKVAMFEAGGEIAIFRACGMPPVFFGTAVAGDRLPNLTYLLGFANPAEMDAAWKRFRDHPDWLSLKADPQYKDTANKITNIVLRPSKGSQL